MAAHGAVGDYVAAGHLLRRTEALQRAGGTTAAAARRASAASSEVDVALLQAFEDVNGPIYCIRSMGNAPWALTTRGVI